MERWTIHLPDAAATERAGAAVAPAITPGIVITLAGDLGAGKTTFARGLIRGLGWRGTVKSPTYTLVEHYPLSKLYLYHFDFYRFDETGNWADEWDDMGAADAFRHDTACLVEWPERVAPLLPPVDLAIRLVADESRGGRRLEAQANSEAGRRCLSALASLA
jgi:tRNA threonylcarbamoyladenosine biosynthesis protein TsaE